MTVGLLSFLVNIFGVLPYVYGITTGRIRPERVSWGIWTVILGLSLMGYKDLGAGDSLWFVIGDFLACLWVFLLAVFRGVGGRSRLDMWCLGIALVGLVLWQLSHNPALVFVGTLTADVMAMLPTLKKSLDDPHSEGVSTYLSSGIAAGLGFIAIGAWNWSLMFYPIYLFLANGIVVQTILVGQYHVRRNT